MENNNETVVQEKLTVGDVIRSIFIYTACIVVVVMAFVFAKSASPEKSLFGFRPYTVLTGSMSPTYKVGDLVIVELTSADRIKVGDVITFSPDSEGEAYITHRVVEKFNHYKGSEYTCFQTKGDANNAVDAFIIDESRVIGKVIFHIPKLGGFIRFVQIKWYIAIPLIILACATVSLSIKAVKMSIRNNKKKTS